VDPAASFEIEPITDEAVRKLSRADDVDSMAYAYLRAWHQAHMAVIHRLFAKGSVEDKVNYLIEADIARKEAWIGSGDRESLQRETGPITAQRAEASGLSDSDDRDVAERNRLYRLMFKGSCNDKITYLMTQKIYFLDACLAATGEELQRYRSVSGLLYL